jgi:glyoxylase-like metal-dependent hydrolase (beta-lactamase superfamily II)
MEGCEPHEIYAPRRAPLGLRAAPALAWAGRNVGGARLEVESRAGGIVHYRLSTRMTRFNHMVVSVYRIGRLLVDTGFSHVEQSLLDALAGVAIDAIALTHHHEDHCGNAGALAARHGCPIFLREPDRRFDEGLEQLRPYRLLWWGIPGRYEPRPLPARLEAAGERLQAVPIPGHSVTHTALFHEQSGAVFTGDLYVSGGATAVMAHENPYASVASLRAVAALEPAWMLTGHGLAVPSPARRLRRKADAIEHAAAQACRLGARGVAVDEIVRQLFPRGQRKDHSMRLLTGGEFSRDNFVRACLRHAPHRSAP